jgi:hypothetical protein
MLGFTGHEIAGLVISGMVGGCVSWIIGLWFYRRAGRDLDRTSVRLALLLEQIGAVPAWGDKGFDGARNTRTVPQSVVVSRLAEPPSKAE